MGPAVIEARDLVKRYPNGSLSLAGVSFAVHDGELVGLIGPPGSGKSTLLKLLATIVTATSGSATIGGHDVRRHARAARAAIGYVAGDGWLDQHLTGMENIVQLARLHGLTHIAADTRIQQLSALLNLKQALGQHIRQTAPPVRRRLSIAAALLNHPRVLLLDDPSSGLETNDRRALWDYLQRLNRLHGVTMVLATDVMEEADRLCHQVLILEQGRIVAHGSPEQLKAGIEGDVVRIDLESTDDVDMKHAAAVSRHLRNATSTALAGGALYVFVRDGAAAVPQLVHVLAEHGLGLKKITFSRPALDDVLVQTTGHPSSDVDADHRGPRSPRLGERSRPRKRE